MRSYIGRFSTSSKDKKGFCNKKGVATCFRELDPRFYLVGVTELVLCSWCYGILIFTWYLEVGGGFSMLEEGLFLGNWFSRNLFLDV